MNMKKLITTLLSALLLVGILAGCGASVSNNSNGEKNTNADTKSEITKIVNEDGKEFVVDIDSKGEIASKAEKISSDKIVICDSEYTFPMDMEDFYADGWSLGGGEFKDEFKPETTTDLISFNAYKGEAYISLRQIYNDSKDIKKLSECKLTAIDISPTRPIDTRELVSKVTFVLPGGITENSKAADVIAAFGDPNNTDEFEGHSYSLEKQLTYTKHKKSGYTYSFNFDDDGYITQVKIEASVD